MKKRLSIEIKKGALDHASRIELLATYKASKSGEKAYFQERLLDYPYYILLRDQEQLVGFRGIELERLASDGKKQLMIELGEAFIMPQFQDVDILPRLALRILLFFWKEILSSKAFFWTEAMHYNPYLAFLKTFKQVYPNYRNETPSIIQKLISHIQGSKQTPEPNAEKQPKRGFSQDIKLIIPSRYRLDSDIHFYAESKTDLISRGLVTMAPINWATTTHLIRLNIKERLQRNISSNGLQTAQRELFPGIMSQTLQSI